MNNHKYAIVVRTSGGLAVVSDPNICNVSMFTNEELTIDAGYEKMITFLQQIIPNTKLIAREVAASYCPGKFDLCINNKKIAGLSQKRLGQTTVIMAYISLSGNQSDRCTLIKEFYQLSKADNTYPKIKNKSMTTLHDLNIDTCHISELKKSNTNITKQFNKWLLSNKQLKQQIKITLQNRQIGR